MLPDNTYSARTRVTIQNGGRIVIPVEMRRLLDLHEGDEIIMTMDDDHGLSLSTQKLALKRMQAHAAKLNLPKNWSDELIAERRLEAQRELSE